MTASPKPTMYCARFFVPGSRVGGSSLIILPGVIATFDAEASGVAFSIRLVAVSTAAVGAAVHREEAEKISAAANKEVHSAT